jgi:hypothetical protein
MKMEMGIKASYIYKCLARNVSGLDLVVHIVENLVNFW